MYHIKNDVRAIKSAELLYEGLIECMKEHSFDEISILDVAEKSTVSRTTFYRNFDYLIDILYWKCNELFQQMFIGYVKENPDLNKTDDFFRYILQFWMQYPDIVEVFITQGRIDIIYNIFMNNADMVKALIHDRLNLPPIENRYYIATHVGIFIGIFQTWIDGGKKESVDDIISFMHSTEMTK